MSEILKPDICVIGAGSGGLTVAATAAAFGVSVVLIEKDKMGGDCLNYGCVPSKALIAAAKHVSSIREGLDFGIKAGDNVTVNMKKVHAHIENTIAAIAPNDSVERFTALGVKVISAAAKFTLIKILSRLAATKSKPAVLSSPPALPHSCHPFLASMKLTILPTKTSSKTPANSTI